MSLVSRCYSRIHFFPRITVHLMNENMDPTLFRAGSMHINR